MMKKLLVATVVATTFATTGSFAAALTVAGGKVTFKGAVTDGACGVKNADQIVTLDTVTAATFTKAGDKGNMNTPFTIDLVNCKSATVKTISVSFSGQNDATATNTLGNAAGGGAATGVGLQLFGPDGKVLPLNTNSGTVPFVTGSVSIPLSVDYVATADAVTAGDVQAVANFNLTYE